MGRTSPPLPEPPPTSPDDLYAKAPPPPPPDTIGDGTGGAAIFVMVLVLGAFGVAGFVLDMSTKRETHRSDAFVVDKVSYCPGAFGCKEKTTIRTTDGSHHVIRGHVDVPGGNKPMAIVRDGYDQFVEFAIVNEASEP